MVGIVVVSHSRALAGAAVALAAEMVHGQDVRIEVAAGLDDGSFGTDAVAVADAVARADDDSGVVVLMDLGSAVLSTETALELLDDDVRDRVVLCAAPLVEGLVVAVVAAAGGADRNEVAAEAADALAAKQSQLGLGEPAAVATEIAAPAPSAPPRPGADDGQVVATFSVGAPHGLHARPAALLVQAVRGHDVTVELRNLTTGAGPVPAASLSRVATLGALRGHEVEVRATGEQAREVVDDVLALAADGFGEGAATAAATAPEPAAAVEPAAIPENAEPVAASPGIGIGPAFALRQTVPVVTEHDVPRGDPEGEWRAVSEAVDAVRTEVARVRATTARDVGGQEAAVFDAHLLLLEDPELLDDVRARIGAGSSAAAAWDGAATEVRDGFAALADPYLQARAADVDAVAGQVLRMLLGAADASAEGVAGVVIAADLTPAQAAGLDPELVVGVVLAGGSPTAHSAILVRARGIPAVVGAGPDVLDVAPGTVVAVDGTRGEIVVDPAPAVLAGLRQRAADLGRRRVAALSRASEPATTRDGVRVLVGANVGSVDDARAAAAAGADLAGLVRTEFLFLGRDQAPGVEEQVATYREIAAALGGRRITLRTLDVGGDKPLGYLPVAPEANPFLGVRGVRLSLARPQVLADQLLAVARVAREVPVNLMFPMVTTVEELAAVRALVDEALARDGGAPAPDLRIGIMVEVPAAALKAARFAPHVDFLSIGTNDLTQYAMAAERGNDALTRLADPLDPGVLRLVDAVCRGAGDDALVAVCGEVAADEAAAALLVGLGVRELSVSPPAVPGVKEAVRACDVAAAAELASRALDAEGAGDVRAMLHG